MYLPPVFDEKRLSSIRSLVNSYPFGTLVMASNGVPAADHLPLLFEQTDRGAWAIRGHVAAANPVVAALEAPGASGLVLFQGPHGYISPTWYVAPGVPTWNYVAVHCRGPARLVRDPAWLEALLARMVCQHDAASVDPKAHPHYPRLLTQIVGFEIVVADLQAKFKLSQNRSLEDRERVIAALRASDRPDQQVLAEWMDTFMREGSGG